MLEKIPSWVLVAVGGSLGSLCRYGVSGIFKATSSIPIGTLLVNTLGSFLLGVIVNLYRLGQINTELIPLIGIGFMGAFTTMSTFAVETTTLYEESFLLAALNFSLMMIFVFIGAFSGKILSMAIYKRGV